QRCAAHVGNQGGDRNFRRNDVGGISQRRTRYDSSRFRQEVLEKFGAHRAPLQRSTLRNTVAAVYDLRPNLYSSMINHCDSSAVISSRPQFWEPNWACARWRLSAAPFNSGLRRNAISNSGMLSRGFPDASKDDPRLA